MSVVILIAALLGVVHEDHKSRFRIDLPEGWKWNPQPGDTTGTCFKKADNGALGNLNVRIIRLDRDGTVQNVINDAEAAVVDEPGYRKLGQKDTTVAGHPTVRRDYTTFVAGNDRTQRRVEDYFFQNGDYAFWLHFEALAEGFDLFRDDVQHLLASFVPLYGSQAAVSIGGRALLLLGRWQKVDDPGLVMELRSDNTYTLGPARGSFAIERSSLVLRVPNEGEERFSFTLQGDELIVSGSNLELPIRYHRMGAKRSGKLAGAWKARDKNIGALRLSPGGQYTFGPLSGNYRTQSDLLVLKPADGGEKIYTLFLDGDVLKLSGGDLSNEVVFDRLKPTEVKATEVKP